MAQPVDVQRKLRQLDNDVQSIYEALASIAGTQMRHGNRLDELGSKLDEHSRKLDADGDKLDRIDVKLDTVIGMLGDGAR